MIFTPRQKFYLKRRKISLSEIERQIELLKKNKAVVNVSKPAVVNDGIVNLDQRHKKYLDIYNYIKGKLKIVKFIPASGAASRMFKVITAVSHDPQLAKDKRYKEDIDKMILSLNNFPFYSKLQNTDDLQKILKEILTEQGLNYANLPKGLIDFHAYPREVRTAFEEHLIEAVNYTKDHNNHCALHFTVSPEHKKLFKQELAKVKSKLEKKLKVKFKISFSFQDPRTDTIALTKNNKLFLDQKKQLLLRPAGHGALINNLKKINADIIVIRNIDNIAHDWLKPVGVKYEQLLIGYFYHIQKQIFKYIKALTIGEYNIEEIKGFIYSVFGKCANFDETFNRSMALDFLERPLRVCGMVKNEGEPGGGPYWVKSSTGCERLQIVEKAQISDKQQKTVMKKSTHFNPVNLVCGIKNYRGKKFDLNKYIDQEAVIITEKSKDGTTLKALERPGLWNGAMAYWNTIFVEVPLDTFTPVKTINDLLRREHQPK